MTTQYSKVYHVVAKPYDEPTAPPIGAIIETITAETPKDTDHALLCDGRKFSADEYPELASVLGGSYAQAGDPADTLRIPDLRGLPWQPDIRPQHRHDLGGMTPLLDAVRAQVRPARPDDPPAERTEVLDGLTFKPLDLWEMREADEPEIVAAFDRYLADGGDDEYLVFRDGYLACAGKDGAVCSGCGVGLAPQTFFTCPYCGAKDDDLGLLSHADTCSWWIAHSALSDLRDTKHATDDSLAEKLAEGLLSILDVIGPRKEKP